MAVLHIKIAKLDQWRRRAQRCWVHWWVALLHTKIAKLDQRRRQRRRRRGRMGGPRQAGGRQRHATVARQRGPEGGPAVAGVGVRAGAWVRQLPTLMSWREPRLRQSLLVVLWCWPLRGRLGQRQEQVGRMLLPRWWLTRVLSWGTLDWQCIAIRLWRSWRWG